LEQPELPRFLESQTSPNIISNRFQSPEILDSLSLPPLQQKKPKIESLNTQKKEYPDRLDAAFKKDDLASTARISARRIEGLSENSKQFEKKMMRSTPVAKMDERYSRMQSTSGYVQRRLKDKYLNSHLFDHRITKDSVSQMREQVDQQMDQFQYLNFSQVAMQTINDSILQHLDSLSPKLPFHKKILNKHDSIRSLVFKKKTFLNLNYFKELIVGLYPSEEQQITLNPNLGFTLGSHFAAGLGPAIHLTYQRRLKANIGLRSFFRWNCLPILHTQVEGTHYFGSVSEGSSEQRSATAGTTPSLAAGAGFTPKLSAKLSVIVQVLYQVIDETIDGTTESSPWTIRFGLNF
ncbi:MAG: hypothetical protein AAF616_13340, partial [Bacteroidota bacterium]